MEGSFLSKRGAGPGAPRPKVTTRTLVSTTTVGTIIEWYDWAIYSNAAALILNELFFPKLSPTVGVLASLATFAVGLVARPLGGLILGHLGDTYGRRSVLVATFLMMGIATTLIGCLPTYETIGIAAPILLVVLRLAQGFGAGAEYAGATSMVVEDAPPAQRGYFASLPIMGMVAGIALAASVTAGMSYLPKDQLASWGWRVPFLLSIVMVVVGAVIRMKVPESKVFEKVKETNRVARMPLGELLRRQPGRVLTGMAANAPLTFNIYVIQVFVLSYVSGRGVASNVPLVGLLLGCILGMILCPIAGKLADRYGRRRTYAAFCLFNGIFSGPFFLLLSTGDTVSIWVGMALGFGLGCITINAVSASFLPELFNARFRFTGVVFTREVSLVLLAAPAPIVATVLTASTGGNPWPVAVLMTFFGFLGAAAALRAPEMRGIDLLTEAERHERVG
ncbi:MFS transporter [Saccharopolyspora karakumensis]|uniref:Putative proline/betaine transporter n=1 Tax=Saccharopolyspora karakumensis TaxID=2530386 RepID=A0A4R5BA14_9PSEU|nr:MFS transporter [Saccharopolyspora karakumensis]TDD81436.1 MFS transporter [Saccharopolyspora karakumensis]